ncbi:tyrosine-type recombinase/integrase [Komagataeibacter intermedius]|uniref:tyrosine-type recombinase/integrase n=1 Tax=Komagataeibacter intermedius TaxID=66229 RepID=UPI003B42FD46
MTQTPSSGKKWNERGGNVRIVRKKLADGTVKEYRYPRKRSDPNPVLDQKSLHALLSAYRKSSEFSHLKERTQNNYLTSIRKIETIGRIPVEGLRRRHILELRDTVARETGNGSANNMIVVLSSILGWGVDRDWLPFNVAYRVKKLPIGSYIAWSESQVETALTCFSEPLRRAVLLAAYTGQRRGDLIKMRWDHWSGRQLYVNQEKKRAGAKDIEVYIPIHPRLAAEMLEWKKDGCDYILENCGEKWVGVNLSKRIALQVRKFGLPAGLNMHGLRKYAAAMLAEAGCTSHQIASITGHSTLEMVEHYTKSARQKVLAREAMDKLQDNFGNHEKTTN